MDYNLLIKDLLKKRGFETEAEMDAFLHPSRDCFHDPFLLSGMREAVERITRAINAQETIVIYGDYDCDGISAVSILDLFFKSRGISPIGFIPSRHTDGYGLSYDTVEFIVKEYQPSLVITVDTGISAKNEVAELKRRGVDVIVTDHHEPPAEIPDTIVVDPKIEGQAYPFNGLSGAGVAFKLVQALSDLDTALKYVDITAISTVGDIVPLLDENRMIVKLGLKEINHKNARPAVAFLRSKLKLKNITSTDIAFKIVPRLNACGRISTAEKCYKFMVEENPNALSSLYDAIEEDNNLRLDMSSKIMSRVDKVLNTINLNHEPAVFIRDDEINLGLIGIVASKLVNTLNRPVFVVTADEAGNLKASVRSVDGINIFNILDKYRELMIDVGGHSLAGGLTISPENYERLKEVVNEELSKIPVDAFKQNVIEEYDAEILPSDINMNLASKLDELEPFGFMNPRPVFKISTETTDYAPLKSIKHYKIGLSHGIEVMSFFGENLVPYFKSNAKKDLLVTMEVDRFFSQPRARATLKHISCKDYKLTDEEDYAFAKEIFYITQDGLPKECSGLTEEKIADFGTLVIINSYERALEYSKNLGLKIMLEPLESGESVIVYNPRRTLDSSRLKMYHKFFVVESTNEAGYLAGLGFDVALISGADKKLSLSLDREAFKNAYIQITRVLPAGGNNFFEAVEVLGGRTKLSPSLITAVVKIGVELGFFELETKEDETLAIVASPTKDKKQLESSIIYNKLKG